MKKRFKLLALLVLVCLVCLPFLKVGLHRIELARYPQKYSALVEQYAGEYGIDPLILYAVVRTESSFKPEAESKVGAKGLMQITEETFAWIKLKLAPYEEVDYSQVFDPAVNIRFGGYFMTRCLERYGGDLATAAAAYHSGWGTVDGLLADPRYTDDGVTLKEFPYPQMNRYVKKITHSYARYQELYGEEA